MKIAKTPTILLALVSLVASASAAITLNISSNPNTGAYFTLSDGATRIPDGSLVRIGTFDSVPAANSTFASLQSSFIEFATTTSGHSAAAGANKGMINRSSIVDGPAAPAETAFQGKQVYLWVYDSAQADTATHAGVFTSTAWAFPDNPDAVPNSLSTSLVSLAIGSADSQAGITAGTPNSYQLARLVTVPESGTVTLSLLALTGLMVRRRR